jgi:hypothetical protein
MTEMSYVTDAPLCMKTQRLACVQNVFRRMLVGIRTEFPISVLYHRYNECEIVASTFWLIKAMAPDSQGAGAVVRYTIGIMFQSSVACHGHCSLIIPSNHPFSL